MTELPRLRPNPIPTIEPLPEYRADGKVAEIYEDIKRVLGVPWVGVLFLAYARYPNFLRVLWDGLAPIAGSRAFADGAASLHEGVAEGVKALEPPPIAKRLQSVGYAPRELDQIRQLFDVFDHGNNQYALTATMARIAVEGVAVGRAGARGEARPQVAAQPFPLVLIEMHHAGADLRALYEDVMRTVDLPFVNTDYRALARWQSYFATAWRDLKPHVGTEPHETLAAAYHRRCVDIVAALPNPAPLAPETLREAAERDASVDELIAVCRLFQYLIPGLATNMAFFAHQLTGD